MAANARTAIKFALSPGQAHDAPQGRDLLAGLGPLPEPIPLLMDSACEDDQTRQLALDFGWIPVVPTRSDQRALPLPSQFLARLAFWAAVLAMLCGIPASIFAADPVTKSFTDSQGRTTLYRYSLKDEWNPRQPQGVLIFFHGNNVGTQQDMLNWLPQEVAYLHDLVPVTVASPEAWPLGTYDGIYSRRPYQGYGTRIWTDEDEQLIHELLQSQFGGDFSVDFGRIVFWGGSAGSSFLHGFVRSYGENYGGGLLAWCGFGLADPFWRPTQQFRERFRVLVNATTEDFTHGRQTGNYGYYKYILGLETRGDLQAPGGHCGGGEYSWETAAGWLLEGTGIPEEPVEPHFERAAVFDYVTGLTVDGAGALWVVRQTPAQEDAAIWRSVDRGTSWEAVSRVPLIVVDIDAVGDALFLTASTPDRWRSNPYRKQLYRSLDGGLNFTIAGGTDNPRLHYVNEPLLTDRDGKLYVMGSYTEADPRDVYVSDDLGESWTSLGLPQEAQYIHITNPDGIWTEQSGLIVVTDDDPAYSAPKAVGKTEGNDWRVLADTPAGPANSIAWDGSSIWGVAGSFPYSVFRSFDLGSSWLETELPSDPAPNAEAIQRFSALNGNQQLVFGGGGNAFLRDGGGVWRLLFGGATFGDWSGGWERHGTIGKYWDARITLDPSSGDVFASDGKGIFLLDAENRALSNVGAAPDIDRDGVPDMRDKFPSNPSEYLDTDGDGIGNQVDSDSDGDGVEDSTDGAPFDRYEVMDTDGDGVGDGADLDDDGDGVLDVFDDFPLDEQEYADTDGDQIGDRLDADDDGDGVNDLADAFPRYPREWLDTDGDGIGDNLDSDDDNDGLADHADPDPLDGPEKPGFLRPADHLSHLFYVLGSRDDPVILPAHQERPSQIIYPDDLGDAPSFGYIRLGDKSSFEIQFAVEEFAWRGWNSLAKVYFDRNGNGDLTDDGPPSVISIGAVNTPGIRIWPLEIPYASGEVVPYGISIDGASLAYGGSTTAGSQISSVPVNYGGSWVGDVAAPNGSMILVQTVDYDIDGVFNRSPEDFVCIDVDGDRGLDCGPDGAERFRHEEPFTLDGQQLRALVAASGHRVELVLAESPSPPPPPPPPLPGKPQAPTVSAATPYSLMVEWMESENTGPAITNYDVQYREGDSGDGFTDAQHQGTARTATLTGLMPDTVYEVQVRATNATGTGDWSESGEGRTRAEQTGDQIYYFPHLAVGASWQTTITYINYSSQEVTCQTDFISDHGTPLMVSFAALGTVVSRTDVLPPGGSVHQETNVDLNASLAPGWARATCSGPVQASLLYRLHNSEGAPTAEAGVNATAVPATRFVTFAEQGEDQFGTGVAYANPSAISVPVTFTARDAVGEVLASVVRTLSPGGHDAHGMAELFGLTSFTGSIEVTSTEPIVSLSLNFEAAPVFSSLPPGELDAAAQGSTTYYFPHLAVGASWQTTITYINYSPEEVTCQTDFISDHGTPLMVSFAALGTVVSRTDVLPPGGSVHQETNVDLNASLAPGWARATCSGPVQASLLYRLHNSEGAPTAEAGVNAATVPATRFVTFAEQGEGQFGTGVAYANPSAISVPVTFTARDAVGEVLASVVRTLSPGGHDAHGMAELFGLTSFTGSIEVTSTEPIVSLSLNFEAAPVFSSLPPGDLDAAPDIPGEMLAPADEAAFNDLFVGKRVRTDIPNYYLDFISPGRFKETEGSEVFSGSYTYRNTGLNTGTVTLNYDDGDRCTFQLTFTSATSGTGTFSCNDGTSGSSSWRLVEILASGAPDLVIQTPSVSDSSPNAGESFTLSATVRNQGNGLSASTTLRYYRSTDATISASDTEVGTDAVGALVASGSSAQSVALTAPAAAGTYYYGACVDPVSGESDTRNNCSRAVTVTVASPNPVILERERAALEALYHATDGPNWVNNKNWLTAAPLGEWHGVGTDGEGRVVELVLFQNGLAGRIPPQLGHLGSVQQLRFGANELTGPIPPELGSLANLAGLFLSNNNLTGPIPPELGSLANLTGWLYLSNNNLTGPIPPELGSLANLAGLFLSNNNLTGPIPPELGDLSTLEDLVLSNNEFTGPVPPEFAEMSSLQELFLTNNPGMEGALPSELTSLRRLEVFLAGGTDLCTPSDPNFQAWLERVHKRRIAACAAGDPPMAYLTQAVQSPEFPVPLVAGEKALLRVFPTARQTTRQGIPAVRARFYVSGRETHVVDIPGKSTPIPTEVDESSLSRSANAEIPGHVVQPGLKMVIEVDPDGTLDPALGVEKRIPDTGHLVVDVRAMPLFDITLVPFIWSETQDSSLVDLVGAMAAEPENHEMFRNVPTLLPIGDLVVKAHEAVVSSSNNAYDLIRNTQAIRAMESGSGYYLGMMSWPLTGPHGLGDRPGRTSFSVPHPFVIAHELGHNMSLSHAACGNPGGLDSSFPYSDGSIGAWGYDFREGGKLVPPDHTDLMGICNQRYWISDYHFTNALRYRLFAEGPPPAAVSSLLLWGGVNAVGEPFLEPAFVVDAPAALPDSAGAFEVTGRDAEGEPLFSLSFAMPETADGDGGSSFLFALPVRPGWAENLSSVTLAGPEGSATLDGDSDRPMVILRNPRTGQVRGFLRDMPPATQAAKAAEDAARRVDEAGLEMLFSRGIPDAESW